MVYMTANLSDCMFEQMTSQTYFLTLIVDEGITVCLVYPWLTSINMLTNLRFKSRFEFSKLIFWEFCLYLPKQLPILLKKLISMVIISENFKSLSVTVFLIQRGKYAINV